MSAIAVGSRWRRNGGNNNLITVEAVEPHDNGPGYEGRGMCLTVSAGKGVHKRTAPMWEDHLRADYTEEPQA